MFVVLEWAEPGKRPGVYCDEPYDTLTEAREIAEGATRRSTAAYGSRHRYTIHQLVEVDPALASGDDQ